MGSIGKSEQSQQSGSSQQSRSFVDPNQQPFLNNLYQQGQNFFNQQQGPGGPGAASQGLVNQLMPQGQQAFSGLTDNSFLSSLQGFSNPNNQLVQQNVDQLGSDLSRQFNEQLLPGIQGNAVASGGLGGGRQGVAQGLAAQGVSDAFARGSSGIRNQAAAQAQQAATAGAGLFGQGAQAQLGGLSQLYNLGFSPQNASFLPFQQFGGLLGGPTVLQEGQGSSFGRGSGTDTSLAFLD